MLMKEALAEEHAAHNKHIKAYFSVIHWSIRDGNGTLCYTNDGEMQWVTVIDKTKFLRGL